MAIEKNYDFLTQASGTMDEKIKNSLSSTSLAFQQTFLSKSMPDLQEIKSTKNAKSFSAAEDGGTEYTPLPNIPPSTSGGVLDAQSELRSRRKSVGDLEDIKFFNSENGDAMYGHEAQFQPELHEGVDRLLIKKRSILNEFSIPNFADRSTRKDIKDYYTQETDDVSIRRDSNLKELTSLMVKKSPRKLTIAEEYQKFQLESKMQNDIKRAQSISNSTLQQKVDACQSNRDGFDSLDSTRQQEQQAQLTAQQQPVRKLGPADVDALINNRNPVVEENEFTLAEPLVGFSTSYEPEDKIPQYSNREQKEAAVKKNDEAEAAVGKTNNEDDKENKSYYPIKMYVKQPKQKGKVGKGKGKEDSSTNNNKGANKKNGAGSYAAIANKKTTNTAKNKQPNNKNLFGKKPKRKIQSAGAVEKPKDNKQKVGETRGEVKSALDETGPFCKCSDEEEEAQADAKHTLDYPIVRPVFHGNYVLDNGSGQPYYIPPQQMPDGGFYIPPQAAQQQQNMAPFRGSVNGNIYFNGNVSEPQQQQQQNQYQQYSAFSKNYNIPSMSDSNNGRYDDCPMAQSYFNKFSSVKTFQSEYLQELKREPKPPVMPKLPVGLHNPSLDMMHTPIEAGFYTTTGQEFLPPVPGQPGHPGHQQVPPAKVDPIRSKDYNGVTSPQNTSSGYSTDEGVVEHRQPVKQKQRITKSFSQNSAEELQDEIIRVRIFFFNYSIKKKKTKDKFCLQNKKADF